LLLVADSLESTLAIGAAQLAGIEHRSCTDAPYYQQFNTLHYRPSHPHSSGHAALLSAFPSADSI